MEQTSLMAYANINKKLGEKQREMLGIFKYYGELYDRKIADILNWPINSVTGRRNELQKKGYIMKVGTTTSDFPPHNRVNLYGIIKGVKNGF